MLWTTLFIFAVWMFWPVIATLITGGPLVGEKVAISDGIQSGLGWSLLFSLVLWVGFSMFVWNERYKTEQRKSAAWFADSAARTERRQAALRRGDKNWWDVQ